ncbi:MAG: starch-binding protein, partial [Acutalibacteraceae bacterium]
PSGNEPTNPTTPTSPTSPTSPTTPSGDGAYAYLANTANWSNPTVYAWKTESEKAFGNWPGKKLTDADKDAAGNYQVYIPEEYIGGGVVFSDNGNSKSLDLDISSGESKIYDNSARTWLDYDTSALKFKSFSTDIASPQYKGTDITISAEASGGEGTISYKFSVKSASSTTVLSDYSIANNSVIWTPQTAGTYTIVVDIKDTAGNENSKSISYVIEDDELSVKPVLKGVTPVTGSEIEANKAATVEVKASGGKVGTNLLFYKVAVKDPDGNAVNTVYYKTSPKLTFTPSKLGTYTIDVSVQNSENTTVTKTYTYKSVGQLTPVEDPLVTEFTVNGADEKPSVVVSTSATITARGAQGTQPYTYQFAVNGKVEQAYSSTNSFVWTPKAAGTYTIEVTIKDANNKLAKKTIEVTVTDAAEFKRGDVDMNGTVNMNDVLLVQKYLAKITTLSEEQLERARITHTTGDPVMNDVLQIQKYLAKIVSEL